MASSSSPTSPDVIDERSLWLPSLIPFELIFKDKNISSTGYKPVAVYTEKDRLESQKKIEECDIELLKDTYEDKGTIEFLAYELKKDFPRREMIFRKKAKEDKKQEDVKEEYTEKLNGGDLFAAVVKKDCPLLLKAKDKRDGPKAPRNIVNESELNDEELSILFNTFNFSEGSFLQGGVINAPALFRDFLAKFVPPGDDDCLDIRLFGGHASPWKIRKEKEDKKNVVYATFEVNDPAFYFIANYSITKDPETNAYTLKLNDHELKCSFALIAKMKEKASFVAASLEYPSFQVPGYKNDDIKQEISTFYRNVLILLPFLDDLSIRKSFYKRVASFPSEVQQEIARMIKENWNEPWFKVNKIREQEFSEDNDIIVAREKARLSASNLEKLLLNPELKEKTIISRVEEILPFINLKEVRDALFESQISFPLKIQEQIDQRIDEVLQEKKFSPLSDEKESVPELAILGAEKAAAKIQRIEKASTSVKSLKYPEHIGNHQTIADFYRQVEGILLFLGEKDIREEFYQKLINFPTPVKTYIQQKIEALWGKEWFGLSTFYKEHTEEDFDKDRIKAMAAGLSSPKDTSEYRLIFEEGLKQFILPSFNDQDIREALYKNLEKNYKVEAEIETVGLIASIIGEKDSKTFPFLLDSKFQEGFTKEKLRIAKECISGLQYPSNQKEIEDQKLIENLSKGVVPYLNDAEVKKAFCDKCYYFSYDAITAVCQLVDQEAKSPERQEILDVLKVYRNSETFPGRRFDEFYKQINGNDSLWKHPFNLGELALAGIESVTSWGVDRFWCLWKTRNHPSKTGWDYLALGVAGFFALTINGPLYIASAISRQVLMRVTSPVRAADEAYQYGGERWGWLLKGASYAASFALMATVAVFAAPLIAAGLTWAGGGAAVASVKSGLAWLSGTVLGPLGADMVGGAAASAGTLSITGLWNKYVWEKYVVKPQAIVRGEGQIVSFSTKKAPLFDPSDMVVSKTLSSTTPTPRPDLGSYQMNKEQNLKYKKLSDTGPETLETLETPESAEDNTFEEEKLIQSRIRSTSR